MVYFLNILLDSLTHLRQKMTLLFCTVTKPVVLVCVSKSYILQELQKNEIFNMWQICSLLLVVLWLNATGHNTFLMWVLTKPIFVN